MRTRIVVADEGEARFYDIDSPQEPLRLVGQLHNPSARLHDRDLKSDRPGRVYDRAPSAGGRRGAVAHHSTGGENGPHEQEVHRFARQVAQAIEQARQRKEFDRWILMAGPRFLGTLRAALSESLRAILVAHVTKDLVHETERDVREHLPSDLF